MPERLAPHIFLPRAALSGYLEIVYGFYMEDKLDVAMQAADDAFENAGWPAGAWTDFYNTLACEANARAASNAVRLDHNLTIEVPREAGDAVCEQVASAALDVCRRVGDLLQVEFRHQCVVAVLLPDAPLKFMSTAYGYAIRKNSLTKVCIRWDDAQDNEKLFATLLHEFTHVACNEITDGERIPSWLAEGLALYVCGRVAHEKCSKLLAQNPEYAQLLSVDGINRALSSRNLRKDNPNLVSAAYGFAGSLVGWWIDRSGIQNVRKAVQLIGEGWNPTFAAHAATKLWLGAIVKQWRKHLTALTTTSPAS